MVDLTMPNGSRVVHACSTDLATLERVARAICASKTCEGSACCCWPANQGRLDCPVDRGAYNSAAIAAFAAIAPNELTAKGTGSMDRLEEAALAFIGNGEVERKPLKAVDFTADKRTDSLITGGYVEVQGENLVCTARGWRHLDSRPLDV